MNAARVQYLSEALEEVEEAFGWYLLRSPEAAAAFLIELERAIALIAERPEIWSVFQRDSRRYILRRFPFDLIYRVAGDQIQVVALAHQSRRPLYWRSR